MENRLKTVKNDARVEEFSRISAKNGLQNGLRTENRKFSFARKP
jgi:hypothetical protein